MPGWINLITLGLALVALWSLALAWASLYTEKPPGRIGMVAVMAAVLPLFVVSVGWQGRARTMRLRARGRRWFLRMEPQGFSFGIGDPPPTAAPPRFLAGGEGPSPSGVREPRRPLGPGPRSASAFLDPTPE
jgi:hypothetical protein